MPTAVTVERPRPAPAANPLPPGPHHPARQAEVTAPGRPERAWLRPGFSLVVVDTAWYACDPLGRARRIKGASIPAGLAGPHEIDPLAHAEFVAGLATAGVAVPGGRGRGLGRRPAAAARPERRPAAVAGDRRVRPAGPQPAACLLGGPGLLVDPLLDLLRRAGISTRLITELPPAPPAAGSAVIWGGPVPFGPAWPALDDAARRGDLTWVRLALDGRWADLEPVARAAGDVTHGMTLQRRLAADRHPAVLRARWSATAVRGPAPLTPAMGRRLAGLVAADLGLTATRPSDDSRLLPAGRPRRLRVAARNRAANPAVEPTRRIRRVDLLTGRWADHPILPVPPAHWRGAPA